MVHGGDVVGGQEVRMLAIGGGVAQAVGKDVRQAKARGTVFVVIPLVELVERQARFGLHRDIQHAWGVRHGGDRGGQSQGRGRGGG